MHLQNKLHSNKCASYGFLVTFSRTNENFDDFLPNEIPFHYFIAIYSGTNKILPQNAYSPNKNGTPFLQECTVRDDTTEFWNYMSCNGF